MCPCDPQQAPAASRDGTDVPNVAVSRGAANVPPVLSTCVSWIKEDVSGLSVFSAVFAVALFIRAPGA